jgi:hypothetical protein
MAVVQDAFFIPDDIATGLSTGLYRRIGSVVRYATGPNKGRIVKHLDPVNLKPAGQAQGIIVRALQFVKQHKKETIITVASAATVGTGLVIYNKVKNREPKVLTEFRMSLRAYIEAIRKGSMDIDKINDLMKCLSALKEYKDYDKISIQLTTEELEVLVGRIYDYTVKLAKDNDVELSDTDIGIIEKNSGSTISNLENYLNAQKHIFEKVA